MAQRSAGAAREIKVLINKSSEEVGSGSRLVQETGAVLSEISRRIVSVSSEVEQIMIAAATSRFRWAKSTARWAPWTR